ncbi:MAG: hypothetical protein OPY06_01665 [Nitrosopumilus sp.]|nr:hypothetical protein [Nitrosopumilus sp.]MDF2423247.1 hypothetical protein [Nitrosopumilus sp.]MDF2424205.1 hypothetical protein [Nitrosopumilus sp.]MDF2425065.1 hypothetical protein [Nitrosopumilus sp.]MDF2426309.1 hypothetical protein [Nitrosopumilus sp.]
MISKSLGIFAILAIMISVTPAFALTELERASIADPRLVNAFGAPVSDKINVNQQIQISADITNHQIKSQNFVYIVQIKNEAGIAVSLGWISGQLTPDQKLSPSLSWSPKESGEFVAEIFAWDGLKNHSALSEYTKLSISVS